MNNQNRTKEELERDLMKLQLDFNEINTLYQNDLSVRQNAENELRKSLSLVEATLESTENGILVISEEGVLVKANKKFAQLWRIPQEIIDSGDDGKMLAYIIGQLDDPDTFLSKVQELYASPYSESLDLLYFKDGRTFERLSKPMLVEGKPVARVWSFLDITGRIRTELERQVMFEIAEGVTGTSNLDEILALIHQSLKKVIYAENCFVALYDYDSGLFSFPYFVDSFDERPLPIALDKSCTAYVFSTGKPLLVTPEIFAGLVENNEVELIGSPSPSWIGVPLQTQSSTIGVLVLQHYGKRDVYREQDVTFLTAVGNQAALVIERRKSEIALADSEKKFRRLVTNINDVVYSVDGNTGEYTYLSPVLYNLIGYTPEDVNRMGGRKAFLSAIFQKGELTAQEDRFDQLRHEPNENVFMDEFWWRCNDGSEKYIADHWIPVYEDGRLVSTDGVLRDITDRKKAEEEITRINEQLQEIIADKDRFFSIIAHDLKSPFNAFLGFTRIMVDELPSLRLDEIQKMALSMSNSATNLYQLLENLLEWSRLQRGLTTFNPAEFLLEPKISGSLLSIHDSAQRKGIEISFELPEGLMVYADDNMLDSIIRNLVSNAVKFTPRMGKAVIVARLSADCCVEICIRDNGIGMNSGILDNLFRIDKRTSRKGTDGEASTGLGLIICKEFIEKHNGSITVDSEEGRGSKFCFKLPLKENGS